MVPRAVSKITFLFGIGSPRLGEQRPELGGEAVGGGGRSVLHRLGGGREVGGAGAIARQVRESADRLVPVDADAMTHHRERAGEPGILARRLVGVEERRRRLNVVVQQAVW